MLIDSESTLSIIGKTTYNHLHEAELLTPTYIKVYTYQTSTPIELEVKFNCSVTANISTIATKFYVMKSTEKCIIGKNTTELLNLSWVGPPTKQEVLQTTGSTKRNPWIQQVVNKYQNIFKGMGTLKNSNLRLHLNKPVQHQYYSSCVDYLTTPKKGIWWSPTITKAWHHRTSTRKNNMAKTCSSSH